MLTNNAILVRFSVGGWGATKYDKKITQEVEDRHGKKGEIGRFNKQLADKKYLTELSSNISMARKFHYQQTMPWLDADGIRILPTVNFIRYQEGMSEFHSKHIAALDKFKSIFSDLIEEARYRLGDKFNLREYPSLSAVLERYRWILTFSPVPESGDFRVDLDKETIQEIEKEMKDRLASSYDGAVLDLFERIHTQTSHMAERLENYTGGKEGSFRDSLIDNTIELSALLPSLNITGNAKLNELARRIDQDLCQYQADVLRENDLARKDVALQAKSIAQDAADIAKSMGALFA